MRPLLDRALQGYNACLFAYGQTGSGKTYSILGSESGPDAGIIPRFCCDLFSRPEVKGRTAGSPSLSLPATPAQDDERVQFQVEMSYVEIYNEKLYDLVGEEDEEGAVREALRVREHPTLGPHIVGAAVHPITSYEQLKMWLCHGNRERSIAATGMNEKSSRSHSVFTLKLTRTQTESVGGEELQHSRVSNISIVDLAGSERIGASGGYADRMKEGVCINKSLLTLGKVITALAESATGKRRCFESLGGNSETAMLATISPASCYAEETLATLRYAGQARNIVNVKHINEDPAARIIRSLKAEVERLRARHSLRVSPTKLFVTERSPVTPANHQKKTNEQLAEEEARRAEEMLVREREIAALKHELSSCTSQLHRAKEEWNRRLEKSARAAAAALGRCEKAGIFVRDVLPSDERPCLVNLCDDEQLSEHLCYALKDGATTLGAQHTDLILKGLHSSGVHCTIYNDQGSLSLKATSGCEVFVNGELIEENCMLRHKDRLVLAGIYFLLVWIPKDETANSGSNDTKNFAYAREELLRCQEQRLRKQILEEEELARRELLQELQLKKQSVQQLQLNL
ncbi:hypothetical protein HAZT_HAZT000171, partial [Hyalella azteca]